MKIKIKQIANMRIVSSGTTIIPAGATVTLDTRSAVPGELYWIASFLNDAVNNARWTSGAIPGVAVLEGVSLFFQRDANVIPEFLLMATNNNTISARTIKWAIIGITP